MSMNLLQNKEYKTWLKDLKQTIVHTQIKAAVKVNATLLQFYWEFGEEIVARQTQASWGDGFLRQLSQDLMAEFPDMKGFSERNVKYIRQWVLFYSSGEAIGQQLVAQLTQIPWGHNLKIISHGPMPAVWPNGRTPLSAGGPCLSPSKRLRTSSASWSALRRLASVPSNEARRSINGFGSFCRNKRPVLSPVEGASPAGAKPGNVKKNLDTKVGATRAGLDLALMVGA